LAGSSHLNSVSRGDIETAQLALTQLQNTLQEFEKSILFLQPQYMGYLPDLTQSHI
jgi:hypothetical protein